MYLVFISCTIPLVLLYKTLPLKPLPPWASDTTLLSPCFWKHLSFLLLNSTNSVYTNRFTQFSMTNKKMKNSCIEKADSERERLPMPMSMSMSVVDLPELALECILEKLQPEDLCTMACVCSSLRERCMSDHLWQRHMDNRWGRIIGCAARREWRWQLASRNSLDYNKVAKQSGLLLDSLSALWPISLVTSSLGSNNKSCELVDSVMSWYVALETGKFSFPAQVYNRENGHVGFLMSCYDAELCYDSRTDTFEARYEPHGRRAIVIEKEVSWERVRAPPAAIHHISPHHLYDSSHSLNQLRPGDHFEIQWRRNKEFPYGWWYGVVGHLESCDANPSYCTCHLSDNVVLEFKQYGEGSRWRSMSISRIDHRETGNESDGFYGGIRKLEDPLEISQWKQLWPSEQLLE